MVKRVNETVVCSTDENPVAGADCNGGDWGAMPWLYGTEEAPEGKFDRLCYTAFHQGGFADEFKKIGDLTDKCKKNPCLLTEFMEVRSRCIELINTGLLKTKDRQSRKSKLKSELLDLRQTIVSKFKMSGRVNKTEFECQTVKEYEAQNNGQCPKKAGEKVGKEFHRGKFQDVVYFATRPEGRWLLSIEDHNFAKSEELVDDGKGMVRSSQAEHKYNRHSAKVQQPGELVGASLVKSARSRSRSRSRRGGRGRRVDREASVSSRESGSHDSILDSDADSDAILASVGGASKAKAKPGKKQQNTRRVGSRMRSKSRSAVRRSRSRTPKRRLDDASSSKKTVDPQEYLIKEGFVRVADKFDANVAAFWSEPKFAKTSMTLKDFQAAMLSHKTDEERMHKEFQTIYWKINKRQARSKPVEVVGIIDRCKDRVKNYRSLVQQFGSSGFDDVDTERYVRSRNALLQDGYNAPEPIFFKVLAHRSKFHSYVVYSKHEKLIEYSSTVCASTGLDEDTIKEINEELYVANLSVVFDSFESRGPDRLVLLSKVQQLLRLVGEGKVQMPGTMPEESAHLAVLFSWDDNPSADTIQSKYDLIKAATGQANYTGLFQVLTQSVGWAAIRSMIKDKLDELKKSDTRGGRVTAVFKELKRIDEGARLSPKDGQQLKQSLTLFVNGVVAEPSNYGAENLTKINNATCGGSIFFKSVLKGQCRPHHSLLSPTHNSPNRALACKGFSRILKAAWKFVGVDCSPRS